MTKMKYSEFLQMILDAYNPENKHFFMCNEAKRIGFYSPFSANPETKKHMKRFLIHMKKLLNIQHARRQLGKNYPVDYSSVLGEYFQYNNDNKANWLRKQIAKHKKAGN